MFAWRGSWSRPPRPPWLLRRGRPSAAEIVFVRRQGPAREIGSVVHALTGELEYAAVFVGSHRLHGHLDAAPGGKGRRGARDGEGIGPLEGRSPTEAVDEVGRIAGHHEAQ